MKKILINKTELNERIERNFCRLREPYYDIDHVFSPLEYDWYGDKEGRALLAFVSHYAIHGRKIPCMEKMLDDIPKKTNKYYFFGDTDTDIINEQQLSGHNWYLRGLLSHYEIFSDERILNYAKSTVENLYLPIKEKLSAYPTENIEKEGGVSGKSCVIKSGWKLSSDTACVFMCIDGLSHYYEISHDNRVLDLLYEFHKLFIMVDKVKIKAQTHCCLSACRGFIRLYKTMGDDIFLKTAKELFNLYISSGMTLTYQNYNWWGKGNTWTEPCAVIDSIMVSTELFKITGDTEYQRLSARIWHNGFAAMQVGNGGAGTTTTVNSTQHYLNTIMYEAEFCCTMRLAEGLRYISENSEYIIAVEEALAKDDSGRYMCGDSIYAEILSDEVLSDYIDFSRSIRIDGLNLLPLVKYYNLPKNVTDRIKQKIIFL